MPDRTGPSSEEENPYRLVVAPGVRRALSESLPEAVANAAWEFISGPLLERPRIVGVPLRKPFEGLWRARRGEYRVRYRINEEGHEVVVLLISLRREVYRS